MELDEIVEKLTGPIAPVGESNEDSLRLVNLAEMMDLIDSLLRNVVAVALRAGQPEASISKAGKRAEQYLKELPESIEL